MKIKYSVPLSPKIWGDLYAKKIFLGGTNFFGQIYGGRVVLHGGLMIRSCQGEWKVPQAHLPLIWTLKTWKFSPTMVGYTLEDNVLISVEFLKDLTLKLIVKRFQRSSHVQFSSCWPVAKYYMWIIVCSTKLNVKSSHFSV